MGWWSVRSGIQVDIEVNLRQRCDSHSWTVKPQRKQVGEKTSWRTYSKPNLLNSKSMQISFAVQKKCVISARTPPQLTKSSACQSHFIHIFPPQWLQNTTWVWNNKVTLSVFKGLSNAPLLFWWRSQNQRVTRTTHDLGGSNAIRSDFVPICYGNGKGFPAYYASPIFGFPV